MIGTAPFKSGEIFKLTNLGIDPKFFKFNVTHLESERYVCIRDADQTGTPQLSIVELFNKMNVVKRPGNKVDGAIMHVKDNIIALKAPNEGKGHILQIFDMDKKAKLKNIEFPENIVFWKWVDEKILAIVTTSSVYHVSIANETDKEVKVFDRNGELKEAQVIGYVLSNDKKWGALFGISTPDQGKTINGHIQLYFIEGQKQQMI
jgi:clathrin heavy chain